MSDDAIAELGEKGSEAAVTEAEAAALAFAEALTLRPHDVPEEVWEMLRGHYNDGQIVEIAAVAALFNGFNRFNDALEVEITAPAAPQ